MIVNYKSDVTLFFFWVCSFLAACVFLPDASYRSSSCPCSLCSSCLFPHHWDGQDNPALPHWEIIDDSKVHWKGWVNTKSSEWKWCSPLVHLRTIQISTLIWALGEWGEREEEENFTWKFYWPSLWVNRNDF